MPWIQDLNVLGGWRWVDGLEQEVGEPIPPAPPPWNEVPQPPPAQPNPWNFNWPAQPAGNWQQIGELQPPQFIVRDEVPMPVQVEPPEIGDLLEPEWDRDEDEEEEDYGERPIIKVKAPQTNEQKEWNRLTNKQEGYDAALYKHIHEGESVMRERSDFDIWPISPKAEANEAEEQREHRLAYIEGFRLGEQAVKKRGENKKHKVKALALP